MTDFDAIIIGGGAAGLMCAIEASKRGRRVLVLEHGDTPAEKIRISGGGRCNFTNSGSGVKNYLSGNPKFAISALSRYKPSDFIALVQRYGIAYHEKTLGQLFCDQSSQQIIDMLLTELRHAGADLRTRAEVSEVRRDENGFLLNLGAEVLTAENLVIATGGKSIPKMGASPFGYRIAEQFGLRVTETRPALVPLTFEPHFLETYKPLSGISIDASVSAGKGRFREALLFTHRGLSGPAVLQASSYWREGEAISIDMAPDRDLFSDLQAVRAAPGKTELVGFLDTFLPKRLAQIIAADFPGRVSEMNDKKLHAIAERVKNWQIKPTGSEGYRTAEVTLGGVDTRDLNPKTMQARDVAGLYFVGEVVDVTGWLGGYNFQWAWSSGWAAGQDV